MKKFYGKRVAAVLSALLMALSIISLPAGTALAAPGEAKLASLSVKNGDQELIELFSPDNLNYNISVPNSVASVDISAVAEDIAEGEDPGASVSGTGTQALNEGENVFDVICTYNPETGEISNTYHITINREEAAADLPDCSLSSLKILDMEGEELVLSPVFDPGTYDYSLEIHTSYIQVLAMAEDPAATVKVENADEVNEDTFIFVFDPGETQLIRVVVTNGETAQKYDINVTWDASSDCSLKSLSVSYDGTGLPLIPEFDPETYDYTLTVNSWVDSVEITAETNDPYAFMWGDGENYLSEGENELRIEIYAENGEDNQTYTITIYRPDAANIYSTDDGFIYEDRGDFLAILGYEGTAGDITIPAEITRDEISKPVTVIANGAFFDNLIITSVVMQSGITKIGDYAFSWCPKLKSITLPDEVKSIGDGAFSWCVELEDVVFGSGLDSIGDEAFSTCVQLKSIELPDGLKTIGMSAFSDCIELGNAIFGDGLEIIGDSAFANCSNLADVTLPDSAKEIGYYAFSYCVSFTSFTLPQNLEYIAEPFLEGCGNLETISAGTNTFYTVQDGVLFALYENGKPLPAGKSILVKYPAKLAGTNYSIPEGVKYIYEWAFESCELESVTIPEGVETLGWYVFADCSELRNVSFPDSLADISDYAFENCTSLVSVSLPENVNYISGSAFAHCSSLTEIIVDPGNVNYMSQDGVLYDADMYALIIFPAGKSGSFTVPSEVEEIGSEAFVGSRITSINIGSGVTSIGDAAFEDCDRLTSVVIPNSVEYLGYDAFYECDKLCAITIGKGIEWWEDSVSYCPKLAAVYFLGNAPDPDYYEGEGHKSKRAHHKYHSNSDDDDYGMFDGCSAYLTIYYASGAKGFTNPWYGYPTVKFYLSSKCTVKYNLNGAPGSIPDSTVYKNGKAVRPLDPVWEAHKFLGWFKEASCKNVWNFSQSKVTAGITFYAGWAEENSAYLESLTAYASGGEGPLVLSREFNAKVYSYTAKLGEYDESFVAAVEPAYKSAVVTFDGVTGLSREYEVKNGETVKSTIVVTSGSFTQTYTLSVTREKSRNNNLSDITCSLGTLTPKFKSDFPLYSLKLTENQPSVTITPVKQHTTSKVYIDGKLVSSKTYTMDTGHGAVCSIKVVSQSGKSKTYTVNISRADSTNADLKNIKTNYKSYTITPAFLAGTTDYTVFLPDNKSSVTLYATKADKYASTKFIDGTKTYKASSKSFSVSNGAKKDIVIRVTAQDGKTIKEYTVHIIRAPKIYSFSASPKPGSYPELSPGGTNRMTFKWKQYGPGHTVIEVQNGAVWYEVYSEDKLAGTYTAGWDGNIEGTPLAPGTYKARISVSNLGAMSSYKTLSFKIKPAPVLTVSASPASFKTGGSYKTKLTVKWNVVTNIKVEVYDSTNMLVATLWAPETLQYAGTKYKYWYGKDASDAALPAGSYTIRVTAGASTKETTVTLTP